MKYYTDEQQKEIFAKNLNRRIEISGKQQKDVALDMGIMPGTLNSWCKARAIPPLSVMRTVSAYFNCSVTDLIDEKPDHSRDFLQKFNALSEENQKEVLQIIDLKLSNQRQKQEEPAALRKAV